MKNPHMKSFSSLMAMKFDVIKIVWRLRCQALLLRTLPFESFSNTSQVQTQHQRKLQWTVPVAQSVSIEMTVPVVTSSEPYMQFFLPSSFTPETAPVPTDPGIKIVNVEGGYYAVFEYSGRSTNANFDKQQRILVNSLERDGVTQKSTPIMATYNGPLTLPFMRRNEVMVMIDWRSE